MVIDDFQYIRFLNTIYRLADLIVVYQDNFFSIHIQQSAPRNQSHIIAAFFNDREVMEPVGFHNVFDIFHGVAHLECHQIFPGHKELHRHTLVDKSCRCEGVIRCVNDDAAPLFCQFFDGLGRSCPLTHHQASGSQFDGRKVSLEPVAGNDQIRRLDHFLHNIRAGCRDRYFPILKDLIRSAADNMPVQGLCNAGKPRPCARQYTAVALVHIGLGDIRDGHDPLQFSFCQHRH